MPDGVRLSADLFVPDGEGPFPTILARTPYDNGRPDLVDRARALADAGYLVVLQDIRGRFDAEGAYDPFRHDADDGFATQEWIGAQPWSNGRIGMWGSSYGGWVQWSSATRGSRHLTAITPRVMATNLHRGLVYRGGALNLGVLLTWGLRTSARTVPEPRGPRLGGGVPRAAGRERRRRRRPRTSRTLARLDRARGRGRLVGARSTSTDAGNRRRRSGAGHGRLVRPLRDRHVRTFARATRTRGQGLASKPHRRRPVAARPERIDDDGRRRLRRALAARSRRALEERWFDRWLRDVNATASTTSRRSRSSSWASTSGVTAPSWPLPGTEVRPWYLHSGGAANRSRATDRSRPTRRADEPADTYVYDPEFPVQTRGGCNCCQPDIIPWGPYDQRDVEMRSDVLVYTSAPLQRDLTVIGPVRVVALGCDRRARHRLDRETRGRPSVRLRGEPL